MDAGQVVTVARQTIWVIVKTSVPLLLVSMIVGLIISLFQTLTSIQEQTLTFVPKLLAIMIALMIMGNCLCRCFGEALVSIYDGRIVCYEFYICIGAI